MLPQHSATATPKFISRFDPAWDSERYYAETANLAEGQRHPLLHYWWGLSRLDLDAPLPIGDRHATVREYLREGVTPVVFVLRRLKMSQLAQVQDLPERQGQVLAFKLGLVQITGHDRIPPTEHSTQLTEASLERLNDILGAAIVYEVGQGVIAASSAPTPAEVKA